MPRWETFKALIFTDGVKQAIRSRAWQRFAQNKPERLGKDNYAPGFQGIGAKSSILLEILILFFIIFALYSIYYFCFFTIFYIFARAH